MVALTIAMLILISCNDVGIVDNPFSGSQSGNDDFVANNTFEDVGNDPNNLYQRGSTLAFDEKYIYYPSDGCINRIDYSGGNKTLIVEEYDVDFENLNIYKGYIYYSIDDFDSYIKRTNLETLETEIIVELEGDSYRKDVDIQSVFIIDGKMFYSYDIDYDNSNINSFAAVLDLNDFSNQTTICQIAEDKDIRFSTDNEYVYVFACTYGNYNRLIHEVYKVSLANTSEMEWLESVTSGDNYDSLIFNTEGFINLSIDRFDKEWSYMRKKYSDMDFEDDEWNPIDSDVVYKEDNLVITDEKRYILDNNMVILNSPMGAEETDIYICKNLDFGNPEKVGTVYSISLLWNGYWNTVGAYKETLYVVEQITELSPVTEESLVIITSDGQMSRVAITE